MQQGTLLLGRAVEQPGDTDFKTLFEAGAADATPTLLADMLRLGSDPVVMVDDGGRILWANDAFRAAAEISMVGQDRGPLLRRSRGLARGDRSVVADGGR